MKAKSRNFKYYTYPINIMKRILTSLRGSAKQSHPTTNIDRDCFVPRNDELMHRKLLRNICLFSIIAISFTACHSSDEGKNENPVSSNLPSVLVCQPQIRGFQNSISLAGEAMANQEVKLYAMSNGYVKMWKYDIGDMVKRGEILAELGNPELMEEQEKAKAELDGVTAIYNRLESVYKKTPELVPLQQVDEAKANYESAVAALNAINSQISYLTIRAPFDGIITNRYVDTGAVVQNGLDRPSTEPLFKVQDISIIRLNVSIPEVNSAYIIKGTPVNITFQDLPNTVMNGVVSRIAYGLNEETKSMLVQIDLSNKDHTIHPGMFANVNFDISSADSTISVPNQAIESYEQQSFIYKVTPVDSTAINLNWDNGVKCVVKKVNVKLGIRTADFSQINYVGLKTSDRVVISGNAQCADGSMVIAKSGKSL
jgi:RND family efflux transporter MFP subunit